MYMSTSSCDMKRVRTCGAGARHPGRWGRGRPCAREARPVGRAGCATHTAWVACKRACGVQRVRARACSGSGRARGGWGQAAMTHDACSSCGRSQQRHVCLRWLGAHHCLCRCHTNDTTHDHVWPLVHSISLMQSTRGRRSVRPHPSHPHSPHCQGVVSPPPPRNPPPALQPSPQKSSCRPWPGQAHGPYHEHGVVAQDVDWEQELGLL